MVKYKCFTPNKVLSTLPLLPCWYTLFEFGYVFVGIELCYCYFWSLFHNNEYTLFHWCFHWRQWLRTHNWKICKIKFQLKVKNCVDWWIWLNCGIMHNTTSISLNKRLWPDCRIPPMNAWSRCRKPLIYWFIIILSPLGTILGILVAYE